MKKFFASFGRFISFDAPDGSGDAATEERVRDTCYGFDSRMDEALMACQYSEDARKFVDYMYRCR